mgnify:CR=1 FL=1
MMRAIALYVIILYTMTVHRCMSVGAGKYKASHDSLTGLLNRDQFYEDVHDMVNKYHDTTFYLICSNIKDFKFINEIFGMEKAIRCS